MSLGLACNFYREPFALPGFLEMATSGYFDDVVMISSPPSDAPPDDESIALVEKAGVRLVHTKIDAGYGVVRTRCIRESQADWVMILDCDERFHTTAPLLRCEGTEGYPQVKKPKLTIQSNGEIDQGTLLKRLIAEAPPQKTGICLSRRHWFNKPGGFDRPCQNWHLIPDWQLRCVRNTPFLFYDPAVKMHEKLLDSRTWSEIDFVRADTEQGPFIDHHHFWAKEADPEGRKLAVETYEKLDKAGTSTMWSKTGF
jgi:glycosyltransferase involved in cell wall biosynthesis